MRKVLPLTLKKHWFDLILSGEKTEEYRELKPYWAKRFNGKEYTHIHFVNGYGLDRPSFVCELLSLNKGIGNSEWGAPATDVFILKLGAISEVKNV